MPDYDALTQRIEAVFKQIERERMQDVPLLNPALQVATVGFQSYENRTVGILITPWMMSLLLLPAEGENWGGLKLGEKTRHRLPANEFRFMVNEIEGIGICQTHSLYSPMHEFMNQDHAVAAAESFMQTLMVEVEDPESDPHDEELLGRILRGEEESDEAERRLGKDDATSDEGPHLTRREFLRGKGA